MNDYTFQFDKVSRRYPHFQLQDINLKLPTGGIMGLIGPNGAGKSTLIRILMGLIAADEGTVTVLGQPIPEQQQAAKRHIGFASEDMRLYKNATLDWHMSLIGRIYPEQWDSKYANHLLKAFDLIAEQKIKGMSHGQRVKSGLLLMLARHPKFLILDEPTTGLDPVARKEVLNEMIAVLQDEERSILFSSHNTQDVEQISDQITFIDRGTLVSSNDKESFIEEWRRVRMRTPENLMLQADGNIKELIRQGANTTLLVRGLTDQMVTDWQQQGATIQHIDYLSLEEIFVAEVEAKRQGDNS
ncbi:ABC transporter ATP-binding protein [Marinicella sediminis]|uniref:ABC transporter ATP-binding protein n=1 Tax=Marinicella sediminis TaxID=1792834 RepID=A0ABV7JB61_9GAMM|nr:ABC transporter ATP-binding protein [Marinicella sediminis]